MTTILLADDNRNIRDYCARELEDEGYQVVVARDGGEALRAVDRRWFDLVVLDIFMPGIDGLEALQRIRSLRPDVPVVFFTSFDDVCQQDERSRYATACVAKHEDLTELKRVIAAALASYRDHRPYRRGLPPAASCGSPAPSPAELPERT